MKLLTVLLTLALCSTGFAQDSPFDTDRDSLYAARIKAVQRATDYNNRCWRIGNRIFIPTPALVWERWISPDEATASLSIRSPYLEDVPFDYEVLFGVSDSSYGGTWAFEREDGLFYFNVAMLLRSDQKRLIGFEVLTKEKPAHSINQQSVMVGCQWIGYGAVTERYIADDVVDAFYFRIPLPSGIDKLGDIKWGGNLTLTTDFNRIHLWTGFTEYTFDTGSPFSPFIMGAIHIDQPKEYYQVKVGVKYDIDDFLIRQDKTTTIPLP